MTARQFAGWPRGAFDVLLQLDGDPTTEVRERLRSDRERLVREPMIALMNDVAAADETYEDVSVFSFKMSWYWQHQVAVIRIRKYLELSLAFDLDGLNVQGAWWFADQAQVERYRRAVDDAGIGEQLAAALYDLREKGFRITGKMLKGVPRGYQPDHMRADLLRHRSVLAQLPLGDDEWLHSAEVVDRVLTVFDDLRSMMFWFRDHVSG